MFVGTFPECAFLSSAPTRSPNTGYGQYGPGGYLTKASVPEELVRAVRSLMQSGRYISETIAATLADYVRYPDEAGPLHER